MVGEGGTVVGGGGVGVLVFGGGVLVGGFVVAVGVRVGVMRGGTLGTKITVPA